MVKNNIGVLELGEGEGFLVFFWFLGKRFKICIIGIVIRIFFFEG